MTTPAETTAAGTTSADVVHLVPHTHWDREWYEPFQRFRLRLVNLLDEVLERAEGDPDFCFTLDGQMAAVDDYLEVRPENRYRVAALVRQGRLAVGPWQILLDEFLCSGETIVRNLELGSAGAQALGSVMPVGYLPDMFGHCAQMPQILRRSGLAHACIWRGVPSSVREHGFRWVAPDGSWVRTEYLPGGYGNGVDLFALPERLAEAVARHRGDVAPWFGDDPVLAMFGTDHSAPLPTLMGMVRGLHQQAPVRLSVGTLTDYVTARDPEQPGLHEVTGELRSHARANVLPGVISVRGQLKRAMARAERMVERYAEPWSALWSDQDHSRFLEMAWRRLVDASCHDSVTGCGVDETAVQVAARIAEAEQLGQAVRDQVLAALASGLGSDSFVVLNPTPAGRTALVELDVALPAVGDAARLSLDDGTPLPVQMLSSAPTVLSEEDVDPADVGTLLARVHGRELFGRLVDRVVVADGEITFHVANAPATSEFDLAALRRELTAAADRRRSPWRVRIVAEPRARVLAAVPLPPLGRAQVRLDTRDDGPAGNAEVAEPVRVEDERALDNGLVRVEVEPAGTLSVRGVDGTALNGVGRLVDGGDRGDSYNWGPPADDLLVDRPDGVRVQVLERGPLRAVLAVERDYSWPSSLDDGDPDRRSADLAAVTVLSLVELRSGEPFVRVTVSFRNPAADHRLRWHVPLTEPAPASSSEGQFAVTERGTEAEGGCGEHPLPTFPASAFVCAGDATVLLDQVSEYELTSGGREVALTLLRSVGMLSVNVHPLRDEPAGPQLAVPAAQRVGDVVEARFGVLPGGGGWAAAGALAAAETFRHDAVARAGTGARGRDSQRSCPGRAGMEVGGEGVVLSSLRRRGGGLEVRVVAMTDAPTAARLAGSFSTATRLDLLGRELEPLGHNLPGVVEVPLQPWEIATLRLTG